MKNSSITISINPSTKLKNKKHSIITKKFKFEKHHNYSNSEPELIMEYINKYNQIEYRDSVGIVIDGCLSMGEGCYKHIMHNVE